MSDRLNPGDSLAVGGSIPSLDGRFTLTLQADGNLVLYHTGGAPAAGAKPMKFPDASGVPANIGFIVGMK